MTPTLYWLLAALVLVVAHLFLTAGFRRQQDGLQWAAGSRDQQKTYTGVAARLGRAQQNLAETVWVFAAAVLMAHVTGREGPLTQWGAALYVLARIAYVPIYALGIRLWRSVAFFAAIIGLVMVLAALF